MKNNIFLQALTPTKLRAGLESNDNPATVEVDDIHHVDPMMPKKTGFTECKESEEHPDSDKVIGDEPDFGSKDEDWVAESQTHTVALESISATMRRYTRMACALEDIAETIDTQLEAGTPIDPVSAAMITTAIDASEVGATPLEDEVALESFAIDLNAATESFSEKLKEKATAILAAWARAWKATVTMFRRRWNYMVEDYSTLIDVLEEKLKSYSELGDVGGKSLGDNAWATDIYCAPGDHTPVDALKGSFRSFTRVRDFVINDISGGDLTNPVVQKDSDGNEIIGREKAEALIKDLTDMLGSLNRVCREEEDYAKATLRSVFPKTSIRGNHILENEFRHTNTKIKPYGLSRAQKTATKSEVEFLLSNARDMHAQCKKLLAMIDDAPEPGKLTDASNRFLFADIARNIGHFMFFRNPFFLLPAAVNAGLAVKRVVSDKIQSVKDGFESRQEFVNARTMTTNLSVLLKDQSIAALLTHADTVRENTRASIRWVEQSIKVEKAAAKSKD